MLKRSKKDAVMAHLTMSGLDKIMLFILKNWINGKVATLKLIKGNIFIVSNESV